MKISTGKLFSFLALALLAVTLIFPFQSSLAQFSSQSALSRAAVPANMSVDDDITAVIIRVLIWAMYLIAFVAIAAFVVAGFLFIFSAGAEQAGTARKILTYAIIGLVIALLGWVILNTVANMLGVGTGWVIFI